MHVLLMRGRLVLSVFLLLCRSHLDQGCWALLCLVSLLFVSFLIALPGHLVLFLFSANHFPSTY